MPRYKIGYPQTGAKTKTRYYFRRSNEYRDNPLYRWHETHLLQESHQFARYDRYFPQEQKRRTPARALIHPEWREMKAGTYAEVEVKHGRLRRPLADGSLVFDPQFPTDSDEHAGTVTLDTPTVSGSGDLNTVAATPLTPTASLVTYSPTQNSITIGLNTPHRFHALAPGAATALLRYLQREAILVARGDGKIPGSFALEASKKGKVVILTGAPSPYCNAFCAGIDLAAHTGAIVHARGSVDGSVAEPPTDSAVGLPRRGRTVTRGNVNGRTVTATHDPLGVSVGHLRDAYVLAAFVAGVDAVEPNLVVVPIANGVTASSLSAILALAPPLRLVTQSVRFSLPDTIFGAPVWSATYQLLSGLARAPAADAINDDDARLAVARAVCAIPGLTLLAGDMVDLGLVSRSAVVSDLAAATVAAEVRTVLRCDGGSLAAAVAQGASVAAVDGAIPRALTPMRRELLRRVFHRAAVVPETADALAERITAAAAEMAPAAKHAAAAAAATAPWAVASSSNGAPSVDDQLAEGHVPSDGVGHTVRPLTGRARARGRASLDAVERAADMFVWEKDDPWLREFVAAVGERDLQAAMDSANAAAAETPAQFAALCVTAIRAAAPDALAQTLAAFHADASKQPQVHGLDSVSSALSGDYERAVLPLLCPKAFTGGERDAIVGAAKYDHWLATLPASDRSAARNPIARGRGRRVSLRGVTLRDTATTEPFAPAAGGRKTAERMAALGMGSWAYTELSASHEAFSAAPALYALARAPTDVVSSITFDLPPPQAPVPPTRLTMPTRASLAAQYGERVISGSDTDTVINISAVRDRAAYTQPLRELAPKHDARDRNAPAAPPAPLAPKEKADTSAGDPVLRIHGMLRLVDAAHHKFSQSTSPFPPPPGSFGRGGGDGGHSRQGGRMSSASAGDERISGF